MPPRRIRIGPTKRNMGENPWEGKGRERREAREGKEEKDDGSSGTGSEHEKAANNNNTKCSVIK